ncbi:hypothetical protein HanHA300_Chr02g0059261 [Helianthus annuus]|nr:hypothetical protein HanHA300_Chr02g0059261 [Helianthus annuus]KAJ0619126.1 hypothetical protein HanHA89_Chr02g0067821 [Helianthus annuus]KAJ0777575.1 hypothetical protein HanLR1_Chr02g0062021 [Helianthus annuus]
MVKLDPKESQLLYVAGRSKPNTNKGGACKTKCYITNNVMCSMKSGTGIRRPPTCDVSICATDMGVDIIMD